MTVNSHNPSEQSAVQQFNDEQYRRWYDHDPVLMEVLEILKNFRSDVRAQAEVFLEKIESSIGKETLEKFYETHHKPDKPFGNRWYDHDPVIYKVVEILRVVPPEVQRKAAMRFLDALKKQGISPEVIQADSHS